MAIVRIIFDGLILGQRCQNVLHFSNPGGAGSDIAIRDELLAHWVPILRNIQNEHLSWTAVSIQTLTPTMTTATVFPLSGQVGSLAGAAAPPPLCGLFSIRTGVAGRHGHGRFYLFGVHQESVENGVLQSGAFGAYQTAANSLVARYNASGSGPIILGVAPRGSPSDWIACIDIVVRPTFGIQRRRNIGVGG
jgi:hypothetical protein